MSANQPLLDQLFPDDPAEDFRPLSGEARKYTGMETCLINTPEEYKERFVSVVKGFLRGYVFTCEDVTALIGRPPEGKGNSIGGLISQCARQGLIQFTGRMPEAKRPGMNATRLMEWRRL